MTLPNFIVIGPGKSGTTWLYRILNEHPQIGMSSVKETLFFSDYYHRGVGWYSKFFSNLDSLESKAVGEVSNTYIFSDTAPQRIYEYKSDIRLISTLRNPIERAFSHYLFLKRNGTQFNSFEEAIEKEPHIIKRGLYFHYLSNYFKNFSRQQILILIYDDLKINSAQYSKSIFEFLDVDQDFTASSQDEKILVASQAKSAFIARILKNIALLFRELGYPEVIEKVKASFIPRLVYKPIDKGGLDYTIDTKTKSFLIDYYSEDVQQLSEFLERDLSSLWLLD